MTLPKGITRDETEHGKVYYTRADLEAYRKPEPLSDAEIDDIFTAVMEQSLGRPGSAVKRVARAIEAAVWERMK